ncbi:maltose alpha-D-glucosyltransferase [Hansschlegelia zhihuaiae]|uniref:maltose alpha-D-glucosyltransferase n=1 Tax=Hansschlegelia zhihuaiae TaxID=405005 RepID=A0A4Q0MNU8_9HYPH|nr:maltose alpha-D-glucosyltransferase [Hansschlegelia zhihuaiae]RXF75323.1 maltose alpha-D-glucosyltransferase [Hansschlegelia zhihuaiae]
MNAPVAHAALAKPTGTVVSREGVDPLWYKDAIIYQLHVKSFMDSNDDGIGDFPGLISKLDYIADLGVNVIWLLPFYPSPRLDDGYDISEYTGVSPDYGTLADVKRFVSEAHKRGIRVISELVINHTSDQHPWFQRARTAKPGSAHRNFYVWSDHDTLYSGTRIIFLDTERSNWTWDPVAGAYFWHRFYSHQPDLNFDNPQVLKAVFKVMKFWLDIGIDGLRLDAVPYLIERDGTSNENLPETHDILKKIRAELDRTYPDRFLIAEANMWPEDTKDYFGEGDECHMAFHFPLMPRMYMSIAREDRFPITDIMRQTPEIPDNCQWAIFLRNHDELTLEMVTDKERDYLWNTYATDRRARINLGIRRRLAPLMERDRRRIELMNSLLLSMPGTPVIYYGDEIGMGDNIHLGDRDGVRTPMQWSIDRNGGFSRADFASIVLPPIMDPLYGYFAINVEAQGRDPHSLLNWMRRMLATRRQHLAFGRGSLRFLFPSNRRILAYLREHDGDVILCVANMGRSPQAVELELSEFEGRVPIELTAGSVFPPIGQLTYLLTLPPYGFYWFLLAEEANSPSWHTPAPEPMADYETLVLRAGVDDAMQVEARKTLETAVLPNYLAKRRWFSGKDQKQVIPRIKAMSRFEGRGQPIGLIEVEVTGGSEPSRWLLPLAVVSEDEPISALASRLALARVRRGREVQLLTDAFALPGFAHAVAKSLKDAARLKSGEGEIVFEQAEGVKIPTLPEDAEINWLSAEQSNSSLIAGDLMMIKVLRKIAPGKHPEAEMGRYLTENGYGNAAPFLGEMVRVAADGTRATLAIIQGYVRNEGDAWSWTLAHLTRALDDFGARGGGEMSEDERFSEYTAFAATLGTRLAELHAVLARDSDDQAFAPAPASTADVKSWQARASGLLTGAIQALRGKELWEDPAARQRADWLIERWEPLQAAIGRLAETGVGSIMTRIHGDLHLGQILVATGDAVFIDFEGEPARPLDERRGKASPLRDVAGVLRSFDYAAAMVGRNEQASPHVSGARRDDFLERFRADAAAAFLDAYRKGVEKSGGAVSADLLDMFLIEKAAYEIGYEAANRPTWIDVPLGGLCALAARLAPEQGGRS